MKKTIENINKAKSCFLKRFLKKSIKLQQTHQKKREQVNKIANVKGKATIYTTEIQRIIRDYYKQLHANKMDKMAEMGKY